jgi:hypothetical protein
VIAVTCIIVATVAGETVVVAIVFPAMLARVAWMIIVSNARTSRSLYRKEKTMPVLNHEFNGLVRFFGSLVPHTLTASQYEDFEALRADYLARGSIKINVDNSSGTIFGDPSLNWLFRAWHDMSHIITGGDFSRKGEYKAMLEMWRQIDAYPFTMSTSSTGALERSKAKRDWFKRIVYAEVMGHFDYHEHFGTFPTDQYQLTDDVLEETFNIPLDSLR